MVNKDIFIFVTKKASCFVDNKQDGLNYIFEVIREEGEVSFHIFTSNKEDAGEKVSIKVSTIDAKNMLDCISAIFEVE